MKTFFALLLSISAATVSPAAGVVKFSTSGESADAGSDLTVSAGSPGSLYVWVSTDPGEVLQGIDLVFDFDTPSVAQATGFETVNGGRWANTQSSLDPAPRAQALSFPGLGAGTGLTTNGQDDFVLFTTLALQGTELGTSGIAISAGPNGIGTSAGNVASSFSFQGGSVTAVPEPSSLAAIGTALFGWVGFRLRRRRRQAAIA